MWLSSWNDLNATVAPSVLGLHHPRPDRSGNTEHPLIQVLCNTVTSLMCRLTDQWTEGPLHRRDVQVRTSGVRKCVCVCVCLCVFVWQCVCIPGAGRQRVSRTSGGEDLNSFSTFYRKKKELLTGLYESNQTRGYSSKSYFIIHQRWVNIADTE